ncbi:MAG: ImmA/IrrE family metallo-endopeptidase [Rickettsiales bacterium]|jgi:hypothetical protein|nr:ImmA/IrrE family metallo-endopeptidase [Rickettsiales bacterium]
MTDILPVIRRNGIPVKSRTSANIRDFAEKFRKRLVEIMGDFGNRCPIDKVFERLGSPEHNCYSIEILPDDAPELKDCLATTDTANKVIKIKEYVYEEACKGGGHARFTLAHELGHLFLKHEFSGNFAMMPGQKIPAYIDSEWQADLFAAELLMPKELVEGKDASDIARECGVSYTAAKIRKERLEREAKKI